LATGVIEMSWPVVELTEAPPPQPHPGELDRHRAQSARTWAVLERLGVEEGAELALEFFFESGGLEADRELAGYLQGICGYRVEIEPGGVSGQTHPMRVGPGPLDRWVTSMLDAGAEHGGCAFRGWTATIQRPERGPGAE